MDNKENIPPNQDFGKIKIQVLKDRMNADKGFQRLQEFMQESAMIVEEDLPTPDSPSCTFMPNLKNNQHSIDKIQSFEQTPILANYVVENPSSDRGCMEIHPFTVFFFAFTFHNPSNHFFDNIQNH